MNWFKTHFELKFDFLSIILLAVACICFDLALFKYIEPEWARPLGILEYIQAAIIIIGAIAAFQFSRDPELPADWRRFWRWSIWCWILVLGRLFNWGRAFFDPSTPRYWFRVVCVVLIVLAVLRFFQTGAFRKAWELLSKVRLPFWVLFIGFSMWMVSEAAERGRFGFDMGPEMSEVLEEMMQIPVFLALVFMTIRIHWKLKEYLGVGADIFQSDEKTAT